MCHQFHPSSGAAARKIKALVLLVLAVGLVMAGGAAAVDIDLPGQPAPSLPGDPVTVRSLWSVDRARPGDNLTLAVVLDVAKDHHINADQTQIKPVAGLKPVATAVRVLTPHPDLVTAPVLYPPAHPVRFDFADQPLMVFEGATVIRIPVAVAAGAAVGKAALEFEIGYQACTDQACLLPARKKLTAVLTIAAAGAAVTASTDPVFAAAPAPAAPDLSFDFFGWRLGLTPDSLPTMAVLLVLALVGGGLLNFTPCVLPLVPIKILGLARAAGTDPRRCAILGLFTFLGVLAFWMGLGLMMAVVSGFTATNQLFQYPVFTITVGIVIAALALGMMGLFEVRVPGFVYLFNPDQERLPGAFGMGVLTAVLSTPCTAPFMGAAAAWAASQRPATALVVFAAIGAGMGLPYLILAGRPAWIKTLPRTGPGSLLLKQVMGLFMMAAAAYFIGTGLSTIGAGATAGESYWWAVAGLAAAAGIWLGWRGWRITAKSGWRAAIGVAAATIVAVAALAGVHLTRRGPVDWMAYTPAAVDQALSAGKIPVLVFTAQWCLNCKALEQTVLRSPEAAKALGAADVAPFKVDLTGGNPEGNDKLRQVGRLAIPLIVVYAPSGKIVFISDFYTTGQLVDAIDRARRDPGSKDQRSQSGQAGTKMATDVRYPKTEIRYLTSDIRPPSFSVLVS